MSLIVAAILTAVLGLVLWGIWRAAQEFAEFEEVFNYGILVMLLLVVGAAVYMGFAMPTIATDSPAKEQPAGKLTTQESNLLQD
jgi:hypothetical protein